MKAFNQKQKDADMKAFNHSAKLKTLILAAMERWEPEEMLEMMYEKCCSKTEREYLKDKMIDLTTFEGGIFIKTDGNIEKQDKIMGFLTTEIYPYHNEQAAVLFNY